MLTLKVREQVRKMLVWRATAAPSHSTTRLWLEVLEDRTLPSAPQPELTSFTASPPAESALKAIVSYVTTAMDQATQLAALLAQNVSNLLTTASQDIAQESSGMRLQLDYILGINPVSPPASDTAVGQSGSGSGSGAATTAHEDPTQSSGAATTQSGSGSGDDGAMGGMSGSCGVYGTTVGFGDFGPFNVPEAGMCEPSSITIPVTVAFPNAYCSVSVNYTTQDGTAIAGTDYTAESGTLGFPAGTSGPDYITIPILDDGDDESVGSESFTVALSDPVNAKLAMPSTVTVNIVEGPQQAATDTLRWNPCPNSDYLASDPTNWYDVTQQFQLQKGAPGPGPGTPIQFDANPNDTPNNNAYIYWNQNYTIASMTLNQYTGSQIIYPQVKVESNGVNDTSLSMDGNSTLNMAFMDARSIFQIDNSATITNMSLAGSSGNGQFIIKGGETLIGTSSSYTDKLGVSMFIYNPGSLLDLGYDTLQLTSDPINIVVTGTMVVDYGTGNGMKLIDSGSNSDDYIDVAGGTLLFNGKFGLLDYFNIPLIVESGGAFQVASGNLTVTGANTSTQSVSVYLKGNSSSVQLSGTSTLECDNDYYQDSGNLETTDSTECTLKNGSTGNDRLNINGGRVMVDTQPDTYGKLDVQAQSLVLKNTTLMVWILGYDPTKANAQNDQLYVKGGSLSVGNTDTLTVGVDGMPQNNDVWLIITADAAMGVDFGTKNSSPQTNGLTYGPPDQPKLGNYRVQMPTS